MATKYRKLLTLGECTARVTVVGLCVQVTQSIICFSLDYVTGIGNCSHTAVQPNGGTILVTLTEAKLKDGVTLLETFCTDCKCLSASSRRTILFTTVSVYRRRKAV